MTLSQWTKTHGVITEGAEPGAFHAYPYQLGILDAMSDPQYERVTWMKSKRVGYTQLITFAQGYYIAADPSPLFLAQPTIDDVKQYSKESFTPMVESMPVLRGLISEKKSRDSQNTLQHKIFPGGAIHFAGANSMRSFRRLTKRVVIGDEIDAWPANLEGDQIKAMIGRTETYGARRKIILGSTPLYDETSRVQRHYRQSDQRVYKVPCPHCGELQPITWSRIKWPKDNPERAYMQCERCEQPIDHSQKADMLEAGLQHGDQGWHAKNAAVTNHAGFWLWAGYSLSPNAAWGLLAKEFLEVKDNPEELMTFTNEVLAETWQTEGDSVQPNELYRKRREHYTVIPQEACLLTAGVDVQKDRLEVEVVAWSRHLESWSMDYRKIYGDPSRPQLWKDLDAYLNETYPHASGVDLKVHAVCVDSGSNMYTQNVYEYCKSRQALRRWPIKGQAGQGLPTVVRATDKNKQRVRLFTLGVDSLKTALFARLAQDEVGPGYCHFPHERQLDYFIGLGAEKAVRHYSRGRYTTAFVHDKKIPNEPIDCRVYATAAVSILNPAWDAYAAIVSVESEPTADPATQLSPTQQLGRRPRRPSSNRGGWVNSW